MKKNKWTVALLALCWLLACTGCGLFRNVDKSRAKTYAQTTHTSRLVKDSIMTHIDSRADLAVSETTRVSGTAIGFLAEGRVMVSPDGTVVADRVQGVVNRAEVRRSSDRFVSCQRAETVQVVSHDGETVDSSWHESSELQKRSRSVWTLYVAALVLAGGLGMIWWYRRRG